MKTTPFLLSATVGLLAAVAPAALQADPADAPKLVAHWTFDEGEGGVVADRSGHANSGDIANDMRGAAWVQGRNGKALAFTGSQETRNENGCVTVKGMGRYDFTGGITVTAWIKTSGARRREGTYEIVSNTVSDRGTGFRFRISWDALHLFSGEGGQGRTWGASSNPAHVNIKSDTWYHVAGTYDGSVFRVYLDGEEVGVSERGLPLTKGRDVICIGAYRDGYAYGFEGVIDEVRVYDSALPHVEILKHAKLR